MDIATSAISATLPLAPAPAAAVVPAAPDQHATARFAELMGTAPVLPNGGVAAMDPSLSATVVPPASASMGDRILGGIQGLSDDMHSAWSSVSSTLDSASLVSTQDLLKLQLNLTQVSVQYELVGKAISRTTQNFDQLVKIQ